VTNELAIVPVSIGQTQIIDVMPPIVFPQGIAEWLMAPVELVTTPEFYSVLYRTDLATVVFPHVNSRRHELILEVRSEPILDSEFKCTQAFASYAARPRNQRRIGKVCPILPPDAILGLTQRFDYHTDVGRLVELKIPRSRADDFGLEPPQAILRDPKNTPVPLQNAELQGQRIE